MEIIPIKTPLLQKKPLKKILGIIKKQGIPINNRDVLVITSKIVSLEENRWVKLPQEKKDWLKLVKKESDQILDLSIPYSLTVKNGVLTVNAGIDISNVARGQVVLWPKNPTSSAEEIRKHFKKTFQKNIGVIISDSVCLPLRKGVSAIALSIAGFEGNRDPRGNHDLLVKNRRLLEPNIADQLAAAASVLMGQADQKIPAVVIKGAPIILSGKSAKDLTKTLKMTQKTCLFRKLYL